MPGRYEPLEVFLKESAAAGVGHVLCLVSDEEIASKSPNYLAAIRQGGISMELLRYDIPDYGIPEEAEALEQVLNRLIALLDDCKAVAIHCAGGRGRTGMVAILLLARMGLSPALAIETVRQAGSAPDTPEQWKFIEERTAGVDLFSPDE